MSLYRYTEFIRAISLKKKKKFPAAAGNFDADESDDTEHIKVVKDAKMLDANNNWAEVQSWW